MSEEKVVTFERIYDAPVDKVWDAWTDAEKVKKWWGPDNVNIPECEIDPRVGGRFYIVMEATEAMGEYAGTRWPMEAKFTELDPNKKLVYEAKAWTEGDEQDTTIETTQVLDLAEVNGKTKINLKATLHKAGPKAGAAVQGMEYGYNQQFDKLTKILAE
ncbi:MAG TPA: SRPBCC domain-containing protein [Candidatus Saccharimonadales bacterium]|nr:SRPBCC domain-containing protein [Candidatus Saccharimonadales bacterium]